VIWFYQAVGSIREFMDLGGDVLWAIMFVLFLMWTFILERIWYIYRVYPSRKRVVVAKWEVRPDTSSWYARKIRDGLISEASIALKRNISVIKALIAICPLLGLMGTVTGMITVFDVMTYSGGGNARAMAGGVSMATVPTMAGMVAALSGVYFGTWLDHKTQTETEKLEDLLQRH
jgi:biopolymer transport protein ExbB